MEYVARVPGSLMLFGEHAVLHGAHAVVCAVDKFINVSLVPRTDSRIVIDSALGHAEFALDNISVESPFTFVGAAMQARAGHIPSGFELNIVAEFSHEVGFGSSAAVTVATLMVLHKWLNGAEVDELALSCEAIAVIRKVQGMGSGADAVASVLRGVVDYCCEPFAAEKIAVRPPITVVYSGSKKPTREVIALVNERLRQNPEHCQRLFQQIDACAKRSAQALRDENWHKLGLLMDEHQGYQAALGTSNDLLDELLTLLRFDGGIYGAKISGSGLGDCVIGLGRLQNSAPFLSSRLSCLGVQLLDVSVAL